MVTVPAKPACLEAPNAATMCMCATQTCATQLHHQQWQLSAAANAMQRTHRHHTEKLGHKDRRELTMRQFHRTIKSRYAPGVIKVAAESSLWLSKAEQCMHACTELSRACSPAQMSTNTHDAGTKSMPQLCVQPGNVQPQLMLCMHRHAMHHACSCCCAAAAPCCSTCSAQRPAVQPSFAVCTSSLG